MDRKIETKYFVLLMVFAYTFSIIIRLIWLNEMSAIDAFHWNHAVMINTNDGYYWAEGARDLLAGLHQPNDLSPVDYPISRLTAFLATVLPIKFETLILWMPAIFGSLIVVPVMLIARVLREDAAGFIAALLAGIAWSYYNRTMIGYYDTDMLTVVLPTFMMWGVLYALKKQKDHLLVIAPVFALMATKWHPGLMNIVLLTFLLVIVYTIIFERKNLFYYKFLILFLFSLLLVNFYLDLFLIVMVTAVFTVLRDHITEKQIIVTGIAAVALYMLFGGYDVITSILHSTYFTRETVGDEANQSLKYFAVVNTVREAGHIPFEMFANRISGNVIIFILSVIGYILFILKHRLFLITLSMVIVGFFALQGGLRFTVFAVPFMALGMGYLVLYLADKLQKTVANKQTAKNFYYVFLLLATIAILYPNIKHVENYKIPVVFNKSEVAVLDKLHKIAKREDYVLTWWDYGYPIRYYSDVKTLIDGGKHTGDANFPVSFALGEDQTTAANMARLAVEYTEKSFNPSIKNDEKDNLEKMMKTYHLQDPEQFFDALKSKDFKLPQKTRDIYFYLPYRMLNIFPTVLMFENIDLKTGGQKSQPFFYYTNNFKDTPEKTYLGSGIVLDKQSASLLLRQQRIPLKRFVTVSYGQEGKLIKNIQILNENASLSVIFLQSYHAFLVVDEKMYNSSYIQLYILENYDKDLFEPVILSPYAKVYRLKR